MDVLPTTVSSFAVSDASGVAKAPRADLKGRELERAAKDFESLFVHRLLEEMKTSIGGEGLLDDSAGEQVQGMFNFYLAQDIGSKGGFGLWKEIARQMKATQAAADASGAAPAQIEVHS